MEPTNPSRRHTHAQVGSRAVEQVTASLDEFCRAESIPPEAAWRLHVAMDELVANIVAHGGAAGSTGVDVWFRRDGRTIEIVVADDGPPFDPLAQAAPDVNAPLDARQPGGLGIALVKSLMDEVCYTRTSQNVLTIRKHIDED